MRKICADDINFVRITAKRLFPVLVVSFEQNLLRNIETIKPKNE